MPQLKKQDQFSPLDDSISFHFFYNSFFEHTHDYYEIMLITHGQATHRINEKEFTTYPREAWLVFPSDKHSLTVNEQCHHLDITLTPIAIKNFCNIIDHSFYASLHATKGPIKIQLTEPSYNHIFSLIHKYQSLGLNEIAKKNGILNCIALHLIEKFYLSYTLQTKAFPKWLTDFLIQLSSEECLSKKPQEIYEMTNYSYSNFERLFKKYIGTSFLTYFNSLKINHAKELLKMTDLPIITIANNLSFSSLSHFYHFFKSETGLSPNKYRKKYLIASKNNGETLQE